MPSPIPAAERAHDVLREEILNGDISPGALISEVEIAARLGISRTPVHEAFLRLQAEDFLDLIPRRGAVVVPIPAQESSDILELRHALEVTAARRLVDMTDARGQLDARTRDLLQQQECFADEGKVSDFAEVDELFHRSIVEASGNALSLRFYASLTDRQRRMTVGAVQGRPEHLKTLVEEHRSLAGFVVNGDPDGFAELLAAHLNGTHAKASQSGQIGWIA